MAQAVKKIKIQIPAGKATPAPPVGTLTEAQVREIAEIKLPDLNAYDIEAAIKQVKGTAANMGVEIK